VHSPDADPGDGYLGEVFRDDLELVLLDDTLKEARGASEGVLAIRLPEGSQRSYLQSDDLAEGLGLVDDLFVTGDIVRRDGKSLYLIGRRKRILNLNGNKYSLDQIQAVLARDLPPGTEVAAVATLDPDGMEMLVVFYSGEADIPSAGIETLLRNYWAKISLGSAHHVPRMPLTQSGKIDLATLRNLTV
jgi:acyl-coenzyme A synthetase/AMP-(fatty) acid ligase